MESRKSEEKSIEPSCTPSSTMRKKGLEIEGYPIEGLSIGGQKTCVIFPTLKTAFDIGRCPQRAISQDFLFISHSHMDHIGGLPMYVVEKLFEVHRVMDQSELKHNLVALDIEEEFQMRKDLKVKAFRTYHVIPSQVTYTMVSPEIAFTWNTMSDFVVDPENSDALRARVLVMESTFVDDAVTIEHARDYGHTHLFEIAHYAERFQNKAILLIHFSARYQADEIKEAIAKLPPSFSGRVFALLEGI